MWRRIVGSTIAFTVLVAALTLAAIQIQQRILRSRADRLLTDIKALQLRASTWSDAQNFMARWGAWGHYDGSCTSKGCDYRVYLGDFFYNHHKLIPDARWLQRAYGRVGGRMSFVAANVLVFNGVIWEKGFALYVEVPPQRGSETPFGGYGYTVIGSSQSVSRFSAYSPAPTVHPDYKIETPAGCTGCLAVYSRFTPYSDPSEANRLMDFNLDCITRWNPCRQKGDVMSAVWRQYLAETQVTDNSMRECTYPVQWLARDSDNAAIVEVVSNRIETWDYPFQVSTVRLVKRLKAATFWEVGTTREVRVFTGTVSLTRTNSPKDVSTKSKFIILFQHHHDVRPYGPEIWLDPCGATPLNGRNLEAVTLGIAQDFAAAFREQR